MEELLLEFKFSESYGKVFPLFAKQSLMNEGLLSNDPDDAGGATIFGISKVFWRKDYKIVKALWDAGKYMEALEYAVDFYYRNFYTTYLERIPIDTAYRTFDFGINAGLKKSVKFLQRTVNQINKIEKSYGAKIYVDGVFGMQTVNAINKVPSSLLLYNYKKRLEEYYRTRKKFWKFGKGWLKRLNRKLRKG